jgi:hypothetical protein
MEKIQIGQKVLDQTGSQSTIPVRICITNNKRSLLKQQYVACLSVLRIRNANPVLDFFHPGSNKERRGKKIVVLPPYSFKLF